jgi:hypothetical protein
MNVKKLKVARDSKIIVRKIRNTIHCNSPHLKGYQQEALKLIDHLEDFNIIVISKYDNRVANSLDIVASRIFPLEYFEASKFFVQLFYRPSIPTTLVIGESLIVISRLLNS